MAEQKRLSLAKNAAYNTIGSLVYCFCQWAMTMVATRISNYENVGILQLSISVTNIFYAIALYSVRTYQISDVKDEFSSGEYIAVRFITSIVSILLCLGYSIAYGYDFKTVLCIAAYMLFKLNEALSDIYHGIQQKNYRMDKICVSYIVRGVVSLLVFGACLYILDDILVSIVIMAAVSLIIVFIYDVKCAAMFDSVKPVFNKQKILKLLITCMPAVISSAGFTAITTIPRQYLEGMFSKTLLGYYANVATPVVVVQLLVVSIFNPLITDLAVHYNNGNFRKFLQIIGKTAIFIFAFAAAAFVGAYLLGEWALVIIYGKDIAEYSYLLYPVIGCSIIYTLCAMCSNTLIIMRKLKSLMVITLLSLGFSAAFGKLFIEKFYMNGVSFCIISAYVLYIILSAALLLKGVVDKKKELVK